MGATPENLPGDLDFIRSIEWGKPNATSQDGRPCHEVRCRIPFRFDAYESFRLGGAPASRVIEDDGDGVKLEPPATGDPGDHDEVDFAQPGGVVLNGVASSTSVDFYGTEMSLRALKDMAGQMMVGGEGGGSGIPYLPKHNHGLSGPVEWDEVIGRTVYAEVVPVEKVRAPYNESESQFILRVSIKLFDEGPARALVRRLHRGEPIGQSIGGWFTMLQIINNEDGEVERVIVHGVELDHLAVTRAPANPDSSGLIRLRSSLERSIAQHRAEKVVVPHLLAGHTVVTSRSVVEAIKAIPQVRHVVSVEENEDGTVSIRYLVAEGERGKHDDEDEMAVAPAEDEGRMVETHNQIEAACSLTVEERDGRIELSWAADESPENLSAAFVNLISGHHGESVGEAVRTAAGIHRFNEEQLTGLGERAAIPFRSYPKADEGTPWSWSSADQNAVLGDPPDFDRYRLVHGWENPDTERDTKARYKLPHHKEVGGQVRTVLRGVEAAMAALNGARGGVDMPEGDRAGVYSHLSRHYDEFDAEAPPLRSVQEVEAERARAAEQDREYDLDAWLSAIEAGDGAAADQAAWLSAYHSSHATEPAESRDGDGSDTIVSDAPGSAPRDDTPTQVADSAGAPSEEHAMPDQVTLDAIRSLFDQALQPVVQRVEALEGNGNRAATEPATPAISPEAQAIVDAAEARAKKAEDHLSAVLAQPVRVGLSASAPMLPEGVVGQSALDDLVGRAKEDAPSMALVVRSLVPQLTEQKVARISASDLELSLAQVLCAAELDGLINPPAQRARWQ